MRKNRVGASFLQGVFLIFKSMCVFVQQGGDEKKRERDKRGVGEKS